jgi:hypothetical protein
MANLILRLRRAVDDTGTAVWSNDQLEDALDTHKLRVHREQLMVDAVNTGAGTTVYKLYHSAFNDFEEGTAYFQVEDAGGTQRGTADYTADYVSGIVTMDDDQAGTALYLTGWSYDLNGAAAELWTERAAKVSSYYNVGLDGHQLSRSQWFDHCEKMSEFYARMARPKIVKAFKYGILE